jgi:hypothetical protein
MKDDIFKGIGIFIFGLFVIFIIFKLFNYHVSIVEGLTNPDGTVTPDAAPTSGEAGSAASYAAAIKAKVVKLQDELLVSKYRKDYETAIINMDDLIGYMMIKQVLNMNLTDDKKANIEVIASLNVLKSAKDSLNTAMTFLDKQ